MKKFEYKEINAEDMNNALLEQLGEEGWELITIFEKAGYEGDKSYYYFKREKEE